MSHEQLYSVVYQIKAILIDAVNHFIFILELYARSLSQLDTKPTKHGSNLIIIIFTLIYSGQERTGMTSSWGRTPSFGPRPPWWAVYDPQLLNDPHACTVQEVGLQCTALRHPCTTVRVVYTTLGTSCIINFWLLIVVFRG